MKHHILFFIILTTILLTTACKKEVYLEVENSTCNLENSTHIAHQKYQAILDEYANQGITGVTMVVAKTNEEVWMGASGYASIEDKIKMNPCHLHHTASLTKSFIGIMILQLIEEGKLSFDTKIATYLSEEVKSYTPNIEDLTIKHLLQQTSGIPDVFDLEFFTRLMNNPEAVYTTEELLKINEGIAPLYSPGTEHTYSDHNFMLLSLIIDAIEGSHIVSLKNRILDPLQLQDIHYHDASYPFIDGVAASYWEQYNDGKVENISDIQNRLTSYIMGSDGIIASPKDMTTFYQKVFSGELLGTEILDIVKTDWVLEKDENRINTAYSHGFMVLETGEENWMGHAGLQIGASCYVYYNLETGTTIGLFTNTGTFISTEKKQLVYYDLWNDIKAAIK